MSRSAAMPTVALCAVVIWSTAAVRDARLGDVGRPDTPAAWVSAQPAGERPAVDVAPGHATVDLRWMGGVGALVLSALTLLLYVYRRRLFILEWTIGWLFLAAALFIASRDEAGPKITDMLAGVSQFLAVCSGLVFVVSVDDFRQRARMYRRYLLGLLPLLIWFALAPLALGQPAVLAPGHLLSAGVLATAGVGYLAVVSRTRFVGAALVGVSFVLIAAANVWLSVQAVPPGAGLNLQLFSLTALLYVFAGLGMHLLVFEDMTWELRRTNRRLESVQAELRRLVVTDALTGCHNRRFFDEIIGREIRRHLRYEIPLSLLFVDVDRFKAVNDSLGHEAGDGVLKHVAGFLVRHLREADYVFRWGGDEFLVLISCTEEEAARKGQHLQEEFARTATGAGLPPGVGLSIGCVELPADVDDVMEVVRTADERMYRDKARGRKKKIRG